MSNDMRVEKGHIDSNRGNNPSHMGSNLSSNVSNNLSSNLNDAGVKSGAGNALFFFSIPFYLLVTVGFWYLFKGLGVETNWKAYGLGVLGWLIGLVLRAPVGLLIRKMPQSRGQTIMTSASGVCEEGVRVVLLVVTAITVPWSASIGQGWAAIEVVYAIIFGYGMMTLRNRSDEKAMQAKQLIKQQQGDIVDANPFWGVLERVFASSYHIGATLVIAANPWLAILMVPAHSLLNLIYTRLLKKSMLLGELWIAVTGTISFVAGLALMGLI